MNLKRFRRSAPAIGRILFLFGMVSIGAFAQATAPWLKAATTIDSWFSGTFALIAGIVLCVVALTQFVFGSHGAKMAAVAEVVIGLSVVLYHQTLVSGF